MLAWRQKLFWLFKAWSKATQHPGLTRTCSGSVSLNRLDLSSIKVSQWFWSLFLLSLLLLSFSYFALKQKAWLLDKKNKRPTAAGSWMIPVDVWLQIDESDLHFCTRLFWKWSLAVPSTLQLQVTLLWFRRHFPPQQLACSTPLLCIEHAKRLLMLSRSVGNVAIMRGEID